MNSFSLSSPLNRDQISQATPQYNTFKSQFYSHQRSYSNQLTSPILPSPISLSKISQFNALSSFSISNNHNNNNNNNNNNNTHNNEDPEPKTFQTPSSHKFIKPIDKSLEDFLNEMSVKKRSQAQTRTSRIYTVKDMSTEFVNLQGSPQSIQSQHSNNSFARQIFQSGLNDSQNIQNKNSQQSCDSPTLKQLNDKEQKFIVVQDNKNEIQDKQSDIQHKNNLINKQQQIIEVQNSQIQQQQQQQQQQQSSSKSQEIQNKQADAQNINTNSPQAKLQNSAISPLLQQFQNMDLRKKVSLMPIKPIEINFSKSTENNNKNDKFKSLKIENNNTSNSQLINRENELESPIEMRLKAKHDELFNFSNSSSEDDDEDTLNDTYDGSIVELKSIQDYKLKSILKKPQSLNYIKYSEREGLYSENINNNNNNTNNNLKKSQNPTYHSRSSSLSILPSNYSQYPFLSQNATPLLNNSPLKNSLKDSNILGNRDMNQISVSTNLNNINNNNNLKDYQITSLDSPYLIEKQPILQRSMSLTKIPKRVTFYINHNEKKNYHTLSQPSLTNPSSFILNTSSKNLKSNQFNKFYSAFKQNLTDSKSTKDIIPSPLVKQNSINNNNNNNTITNNNNNNNSISSNISTTPSSVSSISQFSLLNNASIIAQPVSNSSSAASTPIGSSSQTSIANFIQSSSFDRKIPSQQNYLQSVFKDMKLTKNTKVYLDQKSMSSPTNNSYHNKSNSISIVNTNSPQIYNKINDSSSYKRSPSTDVIFHTQNS